MNNKDIQQIKLFESSQIRTIWDEQIEEYFFVVVDVVATLTESSNPTDYIKKMRKRDEELGKGWGQIVTPLYVATAGENQMYKFPILLRSQNETGLTY